MIEKCQIYRGKNHNYWDNLSWFHALFEIYLDNKKFKIQMQKSQPGILGKF